MIATESPTAPPVEPLAATPRDWLSGDSAWTRREVLIASGLGLAIAALAAYFRTEIVPTDPWHYVQSALSFPSSAWVPLGYTRYGMILPLAPLTRILGDAQVVYYVQPLLGSGLLAASLYLVGWRFWGRIGALLGVVLAFSSPVVFLNLSRGYPDVVSTGVASLAVVLALHARDVGARGGGSALKTLVAVGFLLGGAFEARETTVFLWPLVVVVLWRGPGKVRRFLLVLAPMAAWALTDVAIGLFAYHDALIRVHAFTRQDLASATNPADVAARTQYVGRHRLFYLTAVPKLLAGVSGGWWTLILGAIGLCGLFSRRGGTRFAALWLFVTFFGFVGITGLFFPSHPSGRIDVQRYWISFIPFAGLAAGGVLMDLTEVLAQRLRHHGPTRRAVALVVMTAVSVGPVVSLVRDVTSNSAYVVNGADQLPRLRSYLAGSPSSSSHIFTDLYTQRLLLVYRRPAWGGKQLWTARISDLTGSRRRPKAGDLVVVNSEHDDSCVFCGHSISAWLKHGGRIQKGWKEMWATPTRNLVVYQVSSARQ